MSDALLEEVGVPQVHSDGLSRRLLQQVEKILPAQTVAAQVSTKKDRVQSLSWIS